MIPCSHHITAAGFVKP
uniref:Uncharacterized protein n=1 Tax=Anguilla anguilla TaxID=7936 RepID=A0A0E9T712_ANGAN